MPHEKNFSYKNHCLCYKSKDASGCMVNIADHIFLKNAHRCEDETRQKDSPSLLQVLEQEKELSNGIYVYTKFLLYTITHAGNTVCFTSGRPSFLQLPQSASQCSETPL